MPSESSQLVSIIMPTYNGSKYIARAVRSVLAQHYKEWELIIIDDGSTNESKTSQELQQFLSDSRIHYLINNKNLGIQKTLNRGLNETKGKYIARIDDDDQWIDQEKLEKQVLFLIDHPEHVLVGTGVILVDEEDKELIRYNLPLEDTDIRNKILGKNCFVHSSVMFIKSAVEQVGGYDDSKKVLHMEDYDLWLKLGTIGKFANLPLCAVMFTLREGGLSSKNRIDQMKKSFYIIRKYKKQYPGYLSALARGVVRFVVYGYILQFPLKTYLR